MGEAGLSLDDKYLAASGKVYLSGMQALVRLPMLQAAHDRQHHRHTAGFISGYRGSPLAGYDRELERARGLLEQHRIHFQPGLNEDLAATACWGTQQVGLFPEPLYEGVFSIWYGKAPGLDRSMDAIKHATHAGTAPLGGVLAIVGDDHFGKSSAFGHQSEYAFIDAQMPVLEPADLGELLQLGLFGFALSRYSGSWVGFKLAGSLCDSSATVELPDASRSWPSPSDHQPPSSGLHLRWPDDPQAAEHRVRVQRKEAALAFARAAGIDRLRQPEAPARLGIAARGRTWGLLQEALSLIGVDEGWLSRHGVRLYKPAMVWPIEPQLARTFLADLDQVLVIEDKRPLVEDQLKVLAHDLEVGRPRILGKRDAAGDPLFPESGEIGLQETMAALARLLGLPVPEQPTSATIGPVRTPYFCAGCPHNTSTRVPEGHLAIGGIGCHTLAMFMDRGMRTFSHMGGEGATWIGMAPFTGTRHVFQNMGDGTYQHSGSMGIRAAIAAKVNVTFKILYNDAVAMTGGQSVEGMPSVARIAHELVAEGIENPVVVSDQLDRLRLEDFPRTCRFHERDQLDELQRRLAATPGVTALIYDQTCAAEKRRRRKAGTLPQPMDRLVIHPLVCEGCGDCGVQSNCVALVPKETAFGTRRQVDQNACNVDRSCLKGFCPSFVTIKDGFPRQEPPLDAGPIPEPPPHVPGRNGFRILLAGVGGTGTVTVAAILGVAARIDGHEARVKDVTGMAQKGGTVLSHVQLARADSAPLTDTIPTGQADLLLASDLVVAAGAESGRSVSSSTRVIANSDVVETGLFTRNPAARVGGSALLAAISARCPDTQSLPATRASTAACGEPLGAGLLMLGYAFQSGAIPLSLESLHRAITLNGGAVARNLAAFQWGRRLAHKPSDLLTLGVSEASTDSLASIVEVRREFLTGYQDHRWSERYANLVEQVRKSEQAATPGSEALALAVAVAAFRLMSYKDEYEVARLLSDPGFHSDLRRSFSGPFKLRYHLAPPMLERLDPSTGRPRKRSFGPWLLPVLRLLARMKALRGTSWDPFGRTRERRQERQLIVDYFSLVDGILEGLTPANHALAVQLARLPEEIKGFGPVKEASIAGFRVRKAELLAQWNGLRP